jgi:hypothetical protein
VVVPPLDLAVWAVQHRHSESYQGKQGKVDMATAYALEALETAKALRADLHITKIDALYQNMRSEEKYKSSLKLIRLLTSNGRRECGGSD